MKSGNDNRVVKLLEEMIAIPTVNPMDRSHDGGAPVERALIAYLEGLFEPFDVEMHRDTYSAAHENLVIRTPGRSDGPALLFESHLDTVPADDWPDRAFAPRLEGDIMYGRGACDDKGSLAAMVLALLEVLESKEQPPLPIVLVAAGDEESLQTGIRHFAEMTRETFTAGVFGEPTRNHPVIQHKGTTRWDITTHGQSAHSSRPDLGRNAIYDMMTAIRTLQEYEQSIQHHQSSLMTGPTLTVTMIRGGRTRNAVPDECTIALDLRVVPGMNGSLERDGIIERLNQLDVKMTHSPLHNNVPPLSTSPSHPFVKGVSAICSDVEGRPVEVQGVPYCSDAAWMPGGGPAIVLGPGRIDYAHAVEEQISITEVRRCAGIYRQVMTHPWSQ